jgi:hypothetical protein
MNEGRPMTLTALPHIDETRVEAFTNQVFVDLAACYGGVMVTLGDRLGLYQALADAGPLSSREVADRASCAERYVREWLASQVAAGYIQYDPAAETFQPLPARRGPGRQEPRDVHADRLQRPRLDVARRGPGGGRRPALVPGRPPDRLHAGVAGFIATATASLVADGCPPRRRRGRLTAGAGSPMSIAATY